MKTKKPTKRSAAASSGVALRRTGSKPAETLTFDEIDQRILEILQQDCETPINVISEDVGLSASPCWRRIKRMEEAGIIKGRVVLVDPVRANVSMTIFIGVSTSSHAKGWLENFSTLIDGIPEIVEAYRLAGTMDYILKVVVPDIAMYDHVYKKMIEQLEFSEISSMISMEELKFTTSVPTQYI